ncbi:Uncharacterised protein [Bordetella ansorpii]|uniref:Uncharacterized protein n=1 Tax=Bordetella ansorpii TaxID=288768 RepID=A0A157SID7_9BORD|nr:hypothetical protein [Bordetella ansorpii]SAI70011.1 Uncharacterised protein [Bordetella ansorpii]
MPTALTDLEAQLAAPDGATLRDALASRAAALEARLRAAIAAGLPRDQFPAWQAAAEAAAAAQAVLASHPLQTATASTPPPFASIPSPFTPR